MARTSHRRSREKTGGRCFTFGAILIVLAGTALTLQFIPTTQYEDLLTEMETLKASAAQLAVSTQAAPQSAVEAGAVQQVSAISMQTSGAIVAPFDPRKTPLLIPPGKAQNLPSIRVEDETIEKKRGRTTKYGGSGDKKHLGGFTEFDGAGVSPKVWKWMIRTAGVKSFLDVGCGRGTSTTWFLTHGVDVLCAEGSHDAVTKTFLPDPATQVVEHDFSRGPWWPEKTYDAVWAVEFLEHVNVQYHFNYITAFRKAALIFVTSSRWGGWHHVEVHNDEWWIRKYELYGFQYDQRLTDHVRKLARDESRMMNETAPDGNTYNAQHIWLSMKVFKNPAVGALPEHAHLFPEFGCYQDRTTKRECGTGRGGEAETPLAKELYPLEITIGMDRDWETLIRKNLVTLSGNTSSTTKGATAATP